MNISLNWNLIIFNKIKMLKLAFYVISVTILIKKYLFFYHNDLQWHLLSSIYSILVSSIFILSKMAKFNFVALLELKILFIKVLDLVQFHARRGRRQPFL